jgi:protein TIF31
VAFIHPISYFITNDRFSQSNIADGAFEGGRQALANENIDLASESYLDSLGLYEQVFGSIHSEAATKCHNLAIVYHTVFQNLTRKVEIHENAQAAYEAMTEEQKVEALPKVQEVLLSDPEAVRLQGQNYLTQAIQLVRQSIIVAERTSALDGSEAIQQYSDLALLENTIGNVEAALRLTKHAVGLLVTTYGPDHPTILTLLVRYFLPLAPSLDSD